MENNIIWKKVLGSVVWAYKLPGNFIKFPNSLFSILHSKKNGMAALPVVLLLGGFITEIVVVLMATSYLSLGTELGIRLSADAYFAARSGVNDGLMKIVRDKNFTSSAYTLTVGDAVAQVTVCKDAPCTDNGKSKITSIGITQSRTRRFEAVATVDSLTGEVGLESLKEITQTAAPSGSGLRVFVTSAVYNGNLGGLSGADAKCRALAIAASLGGTWKAWLSTNSISAASRLVHETSPYKLVNGIVIADNWADLTDGSLAAPINVTETGINFSTPVWTNTAINGSSAYTDQYDCSGWTDSQPFPGSSGYSGFMDSYWTTSGAQGCSRSYALYCFEQSGTVPTPPNLVATGEIGQIVLNWSVPSSDGGKAITNYKIYRGLTSGSETFLITIGNVLTYTDSGITEGTTYYYKVSAVNAVGESLMSNEVNARSASIPDAPANLAGTGGYRQVALAWSAASPNGSAVTNYKIYKKLTSGVGNGDYFTTIGNLTNFTDMSLEDNTHYYYKVSAINALGEGPLSNEADVRTATIPDSPVGLGIYSGDKQILFSWEPPANDGGSSITSYNVYRGPSYDELVNVGSVGSTQTPDSLGLGKTHYWHDTNLINGIYYFYRVTAVNAVGESWMSGGEYIAAGAPMNLSATPGNEAVNLSWTAPVGSPAISRYEIWRGASEDGEGYVNYVAGSTLSYRDTSAPRGVNNFYKIKAVYPDASGAFSNESLNRYIWQNTSGSGIYGQTCNTWLSNSGQQGIGSPNTPCTVGNGEPAVACNDRLGSQPACVYWSEYYDIRASSKSPDISDLSWYPRASGAFYNNPALFETIYTQTLR